MVVTNSVSSVEPKNINYKSSVERGNLTALPVLPKTIKYMLLMVFGSTYTAHQPALAGMFATSPVHVQSDVVSTDLQV